MERWNTLCERITTVVLTQTAPPAQPYRDPMRIIGGEDNPTKTENIARYYGAVELFEILKTAFIIVCISAVLISLISLLFVNKAEMVADKKANIVHKLTIVLIISSFGSLLTIIYMFLDAVFYLF